MSTANAVLSAMSQYKIHQEGNGRYRSNSPLRVGSDGMNFSLTIEGDENGAWYDHKENRGGSLYELAKILNIETPRANVASTKRAYAGIEDYAKAHGVTVDDLTHWYWREEQCPNPKHKQRPALGFPTHGGRRWRFLDGDKPSYISESRYVQCWYGLSKEVAASVDASLPLVICNGEISTIAGQAHGIAAVCVTAGEKASIPEILMSELKKSVKPDTPIIVALDCDDKGRLSAAGMAAQLTAAGFNARAIDLGLSDGGDLSDFCMLHGREAAACLLQCAPLAAPKQTALPTPQKTLRNYGVPQDKILASGKRWVLMTTDNLSYVPPVRWLLKPYVVDKGINAIVGPSGSGKSFFAIWIALQIAQKGPVIYMAYEGEFGYNARILACQRHYGYRKNFHIVLGSMSFTDDDDVQTFLDAVKDIKPVCIIIDTMARSMGGELDENMARDMGRYLDRVDMVRGTLDCAAVLVHHTGKNGGYRGSSAFFGSMDGVIEISPQDDLIAISSSKAKDSADNAYALMALKEVDTGLRTDDGLAMYAPVIVAADTQPQNKKELTKGQRKVLEVVALEVYKYGARYSDISAALDNRVAGGQLSRYLSALLEKEYIEQEDKGSAYTITNAGRDALNAGKPWQDPEETQPAPLATPKNNGRLPGMPATESRYHEAGL